MINWPQMHPATNLAFTSIQLFEGRTWYQLQAVDKERLFTESQEESSAGPWWKMQITAYFGGNTTNHILTSGILAHEQFVVIFQDRDGNVRLIGNEDSGASFKANYNSGDSDSSRKRNISFTWEHTMPAPIYIGSLEDIQDDLIVPPFAQMGDFNEDFSEDFK